MAPFNGVPSRPQQIVLAMAPKVTASLSILGSSYIIADNCRKKKNLMKRTTYHRLLIGLSTCDLLMSVGLFTSTWPMPADTPHVFGAIGNVQTCEAIGFIEQAGVAAVMYNASLSCYYLARIRYGWTPTRIQKRLEPFMHAVPILFGLATMIAALVLNLYNSGIFDCWIAPYPQGCAESWRTSEQEQLENPCVRGNNASLYQWLFDVIPKWTCVLLVTVNMWLVHRAVYLQEKSTLQRTLRGTWSSLQTPSSRLPSPRLARRLARQSYLYVGALYITYIPVIITRATELITGHVYYGMLLLISITIPLQGFWNVIVYLRPRYLAQRDARRRQRRQQQKSSLARSSKFFLEFVKNVSQVVQEGGLENEEVEEQENAEETAEAQHPDPLVLDTTAATTVAIEYNTPEKAEEPTEELTEAQHQPLVIDSAATMAIPSDKKVHPNNKVSEEGG